MPPHSRSITTCSGSETGRLELKASAEEIIQLLAAGRDSVKAVDHSPEQTATLVVDIRSRRAFRRQHIPGSHNIPKPLLVSSELPQADMILVDQSGTTSAALIEILHELGHHRLIRHLSGGLNHWAERGFPLHHPEATGGLLKEDGLPWRPVLIAAALLLTMQHLSVGLLILCLTVVTSPLLLHQFSEGVLRRVGKRGVQA